jgi:hypothetical protein
VTWLLFAVHVGVSAMWLGAMGYSLFVVQPRLARLVNGDPVRVEEIHRELAHGNRWRVVALIAVLWLTAIGLAVLRPGGWILVAVKALALAGASVLFWWVSWRGWPARVFALPGELAPLQRRFRRIALAMFASVAVIVVASLAQLRGVA